MDARDQALGGDARRGPSARRSLAAHDLSIDQRLLVVALNYIPVLHVGAVAAVGLWPWAGAGWRIAVALGTLYLLPALAARALITAFPIRSTVLRIGTREFFEWWALLNLQMVFARLPMLEEAMRMVPAMYSAWLRLWGSRIGRLVFWSPGTRVLDRSFLDIGDDVLFGVSVEAIPHLMVRNDRGENEVLLAPVKIGDRAVVGGFSLLGPGTEIAAGEATSARLVLHPFTKWRDGKRVRE